ncbi:hypothetical protein FRB90_006989, partial [Tulasnella sp. 427]
MSDNEEVEVEKKPVIKPEKIAITVRDSESGTGMTVLNTAEDQEFNAFDRIRQQP